PRHRYRCSAPGCPAGSKLAESAKTPAIRPVSGRRGAREPIARGDRCEPKRSRDRPRSQMMDARGTIAELALSVSPPAVHAAVARDAAGELVARGDVPERDLAQHLDRLGAERAERIVLGSVRRTDTQLTVVVSAPTPDVAVCAADSA